MQSNWAQYRLEASGIQVIERDWGFISYCILPDACYIEDLWIAPEVRSAKNGTVLVSEVEVRAREAGSKTLIVGIDTFNKTSDIALLAALHAKFKPFRAENNRVWLQREIVYG